MTNEVLSQGVRVQRTKSGHPVWDGQKDLLLVLSDLHRIGTRRLTGNAYLHKPHGQLNASKQMGREVRGIQNYSARHQPVPKTAGHLGVEFLFPPEVAEL